MKELQKVLDTHGAPPVDWHLLNEGDRILMEVDREQPDGSVWTPLSDTIIDHCFPRADTTLEYAHYTSLATLQSILTSGEWRLYCVLKRITEHEYQTFCHDHGLDGYLQNDANSGRPKFETNCRDLFYTSLTCEPNPDEATLWRDFGDHGRGVKLFVRLRPVGRRVDVRPVRYQDPHVSTIIQGLMSACRKHYRKELVLRGIARIAAFYLPFGYYGHEREIRLLVKRFPPVQGAHNPWRIVREDGLLAKLSGMSGVPGMLEYLPLPLNQPNDFCRIDILRIEPGPRCDCWAICDFLQRNPTYGYLAQAARDALRSAVINRAYGIWDREKRPEGRAWAHWFQAKAELGVPEDYYI